MSGGSGRFSVKQGSVLAFQWESGRTFALPLFNFTASPEPCKPHQARLQVTLARCPPSDRGSLGQLWTEREGAHLLFT